MNSTGQNPTGINALLKGDAVRRIEPESGATLYAALDVVAALTDWQTAPELWNQIKVHEPQLARQVQRADFPADAGRPLTHEALPLEGVFRLIQSIPSPRAERLKNWLAKSARDHLLEAENPEMLALRARRIYEKQGYSRRWVDKRLRGVSARQELTGEWYRRGATDSEQFRELTNRLMRRAFGMDVEQYRRYKNLSGSQNLRDHMSDLELALTTLGETAAVALHQARDSNSLSDLRADTEDAGRIVARTRKQIERLSDRSVVNAQKHGPLTETDPQSPRRRRGAAGELLPGQGLRSASKLAEQGEDMQNSSPSHPRRTVA
jgi:DNA-damage-inducible protein D